MNSLATHYKGYEDLTNAQSQCKQRRGCGCENRAYDPQCSPILLIAQEIPTCTQS